MNEEWRKLAVAASREAARVILEHYRRREAIGSKSDCSPLAKADLASHSAICKELERTGIPIVSEEGDDLRLDAVRYWLIDSLDGTRRIHRQHRAHGRSAPGTRCRARTGARRVVRRRGPSLGTWMERREAPRQACLPLGRSQTYRMAVSRFHNHPDTDAFASRNGIPIRLAIGSALKFRRLAAAEVDVDPRFAGSSEWDIAAGHAVLECAGGDVLDWNRGRSLEYGKPQRRNPRLLALRAPYRRSDFECRLYEGELP